MHNDYNDTLPSYSNQSLAAAAGDWQTSQSSLCSAQRGKEKVQRGP